MAPLYQKPFRVINLVAPKGAIEWRHSDDATSVRLLAIVMELRQRMLGTIRDRLGRSMGIASYTVPSFRMTEKTTQGANISSWLRFAEQNLIADASTFSHLAITDVQNFYPSVYTHSLAWAVDSRPIIKANRRTLATTSAIVSTDFSKAHTTIKRMAYRLAQW